MARQEKEKPTIEVVWKLDGVTAKVIGAYSETRDQWQLTSFRNGKRIEARDTTSVWAEAGDMIDLALTQALDGD